MNKLQNILARLGFSRRDAIDLEKAIGSSGTAIMAIEKRISKIEKQLANISTQQPTPITVKTTRTLRGVTASVNSPVEISVNSVEGIQPKAKVTFNDITYNNSPLTAVITIVGTDSITVIPIVTSDFEFTLPADSTLTIIN